MATGARGGEPHTHTHTHNTHTHDTARTTHLYPKEGLVVAYQELDDVVAVLEPGAVERVPRFLVEEIGPEHDRYTRTHTHTERCQPPMVVALRLWGW